MHSQCTLACPTLFVWSCIQVHGLGLRTQTRGFKEAARNQKNTKTKSGSESFGFGWIFGFLVLHCCLFLGRKTKKITHVFWVFTVSRSRNCAKTLAIFGFSLKTKNTCVFCVFAVSRSLNRAKTLAIFCFSRFFHAKTEITHAFCWFFSEATPKKKKNTLFFGFSTQKPKNTVQNQKKIQPKPKDSLPDFGLLGFLVSGGFAESQNCGKQLCKTNGRMCQCFNRKTGQNTGNSSFLTRKPRKKQVFFRS